MLKFLTHESEETYHSRSKNGEMMSSHMLSLFSRSPWKYFQTITGQHSDPDKPEYIVGRAAHKLILEGREAFNESYVVADGPINPKTGMPFGKATNAYQSWLADQVGEVITNEDFAVIEAMHKSCENHSAIGELLDEGEAEGVVRAKLQGIPCQIRIDWFHPKHGIVDLKTCRDIEFFEKDCRDFGYAFQLAFYQAVLFEKTGVLYPVHIIAVDKTDFHIAGRWDIPQCELKKCAAINDASLKRLAHCRETGIWETGFERTRIYSTEKP